jgi:hypothetical protein
MHFTHSSGDLSVGFHSVPAVKLFFSLSQTLGAKAHIDSQRLSGTSGTRALTQINFCAIKNHHTDTNREQQG